ncbi:MAG: hypothetical protein LBG65_05225 [Puniceicoccales bacterium]|jgi:hypothetical protein|nr:hypothetical protein [Puniceicoccales bacterium]
MPASSAISRPLSRDQAFGTSPAPWEAAALLQYGGDRTLAHVIENEVLTATPGRAPALERRLLDLLTHPATTLAGKDFACRMLAIVGSEAAIPVLTLFLKDPATAHPARMALEGIGVAKTPEKPPQTLEGAPAAPARAPS